MPRGASGVNTQRPPAVASPWCQVCEGLVSALTLVVGWEALIVLRDIRGLTAAEAEDVSAWMASALLERTLAEDAD